MHIRRIFRNRGLNVLYYRLKNSIEEIEEKHPNRADLLEPMKNSLDEVKESIIYFDHCERQNTVNSSRIYGLELENMKLKQENSSLNKHITNLLTGL